jgi:hypothetical protein
MKARILTSLFILGLLAAPAWAVTGTAPPKPPKNAALLPSESQSLRALEDPALGDLRAGAVAPAAPIQEVERAALVAAESRSADLMDLRAGDVTLTDHDLMIIGIVIGVVILILIL